MLRLCAFCCLFSLFHVCCKSNSGSNAPSQNSLEMMMNTLDKIIDAHQISLRIGHTVLTPSPNMFDKAMEAMKIYNERSALPGLIDDTLNPAFLDPLKTQAFLLGLANIALPVLQSLHGKTIYLNHWNLKLAPGYPVTAETLERGFELEMVGNAMDSMPDILLKAPEDIDLARKIASQAKQVAFLENELVGNMESEEKAIRAGGEGNLSKVLEQLSYARSRRYAAASVWKANLEVLTRLYPGDLSIIKEMEEARDATARYLVAPPSGMPD
jgi:hypothetical protein